MAALSRARRSHNSVQKYAGAGRSAVGLHKNFDALLRTLCPHSALDTAMASTATTPRPEFHAALAVYPRLLLSLLCSWVVAALAYTSSDGGWLAAVLVVMSINAAWITIETACSAARRNSRPSPLARAEASRYDAGVTTPAPLSRAGKHAAEPDCVQALLAEIEAGYPAAAIARDAQAIVHASRQQRSRQGTLDAFLHEFGLSNTEGVTLMCLAESLLRVPDADTQDALIAEKIRAGDWGRHRGQSDKLFVNAGVWALMLDRPAWWKPEDTARADPGGWLSGLMSRSSEPLIRAAINQAMAIMGGQFVYGRSIGEALARRSRADAANARYSFDMLGEGARTTAAARHYQKVYGQAVAAVAQANTQQPGASVSIKLSALHPRYEARQREVVRRELWPRLLELALQAAAGGVELTLDAEEADRLDLSLELFADLACAPRLAGWQGLGLAVQAYQKRAPGVIDWLAELATRSQRCIPVRLVKGAYWDTEIKHSQVLGPTATTRSTPARRIPTCLTWCVPAGCWPTRGDCTRSFATHKRPLHRRHLATGPGPGLRISTSARHGRAALPGGHAKTVIGDAVPLRVYAPVGAHRELLPYLVRRLLENGANTSFVHRFSGTRDEAVEQVVADPVTTTRERGAPWRGAIALPAELYGPRTGPTRKAWTSATRRRSTRRWSKCVSAANSQWRRIAGWTAKPPATQPARCTRRSMAG